jgi:hypothetical protein
VKVLCREGIANHTDPESRVVQGEALTGESVGQPLSRESDKSVQGADVVSVTEGNTDEHALASARKALRGLRPWYAETLFAGNREISGLIAPGVLERSASGRRGVKADDARAGEVRPFYSVR